jgi:hypothetical protein
MNFATYNRPWLDEMRAQKERIVQSGALDRLKSRLLEQHAHKDPLLPVPLICDRAAFDALANAGLLVMSAQTKILRSLLQQQSRSEMLRRFHIPETMEDVVDWDELVAGDHTICRFDVVPSDDGYYFCELNPDSSVGGPEIADFVQVFCDAVGWPLADDMASPQHASVGLMRRVAAARGLKRVVLCDWSVNRGNGHLGFDLLRQHLVRALPELEVHLLYEDQYPAAWLAPAEGARTLVHRGFMYQDMTDGGAFVRRLRESGATVINTFETEIRMNKGWLAMFCDPQYHALLTPAEIEAITTYVPSTVAITPDSLEDLLGRKAELVFKLGVGYGGDGVWIGAEHAADHLRELIQAKGLARWIAQKLITFGGVALPVDARFELIPHNVVLGLYLIDGKASGLLLRASSSSKVVNVQSGAGAYGWAIPMTPAEQARHLATLGAARTQR